MSARVGWAATLSAQFERSRRTKVGIRRKGNPSDARRLARSRPISQRLTIKLLGESAIKEASHVVGQPLCEHLGLLQR